MFKALSSESVSNNFANSISAMNNLAYMLARDALHTLAAVARQAPQGVDGFVGGLSFENPSKGLMQTGDISINASSQVQLAIGDARPLYTAVCVAVAAG